MVKKILQFSALKKFCLWGMGGFALILFSSNFSFANQPSAAASNTGVSDASKSNPAPDGMKEKQIVDLNRSLKNIIEDNAKLIKQNEDLQSQVQRIKKEQDVDREKYEDLKADHDDLSKSLSNMKGDNRKYNQEMKKLEDDLARLKERENEYSVRAQQLEEELSQQNEMQKEEIPAASMTPEEVRAKEARTLDLIAKIDAFNEADQRLRSDSAKAHYNMGNIYYQRGEYEIAAREYYQAVTLMPDDPDAHYNLAFLSGEYLDDHDTALKHYKMYLYLNPSAPDANFVKEKIVDAELYIRTRIDSPIDTKN